jgi:hypothetical protein
MEESLCHIEIIKDGKEFVARAQSQSGGDREYRNAIFEDLLTELVIDLQEEFGET